MKADLHLHTQVDRVERDFSFLLEKEEEAGVDWVVVANLDQWPVHFDFRHDHPIFGLEITTDLVGQEAHILAYFPEFKPCVRDFLAQQEVHRQARMERLISGFVSAGLSISLPPHAAMSQLVQALTQHFHQLSESEVYRTLLSEDSPYYVPPAGYPTSPLVVEFIREQGGLPILAHPGRLAITFDLIRELRNSGLAGLEVFTPYHSRQQVAMYQEFCIQDSLLLTGGSDIAHELWGDIPPIPGLGFSFVEGKDLDRFLTALFR